jgi:[acyl-carrier-protein] S-malonyltransferase
MDRTAFIFPGQGSQHVGMGRDLHETYPVVRETFDTANEVLGFDIAAICFDGPEEKLREVVKARGEAMFAAGREQPGAMAAIMGMPEENFSGFLKEARTAGIIEPANYNSPVQVVVSGDVAAIEKATETARSHGAKRAIRLNVSGAFHSPLMKAAQDRLGSTLAAVGFGQARIPVVSNVTATAVTQAEEIAGLLEKQLTSPVLWHQSMDYIARQGVTSFVEVGPGEVLCGLLKRIRPEAHCVSCSDKETVEGFLKGVSA